MKDKYVIIDIRTNDFMKDKDKNICVYDDIDDALLTCGMYEFANVWIAKLEYNYIDKGF